MKRVTVPLLLTTLALGGCGSQAGSGSSSTERPAERPATPLRITAPTPETNAVRRPDLVFQGTSAPGADVMVDGNTATVAPDGTWKAKIDLSVGTTSYAVEASMDGHVNTTREVQVQRKRTAAEIAKARALRAKRKREAAERRRVAAAKRAAAKARRQAAAAARVADFKASCTPIPYNQLAKNPSKYEGDRVVFQGQIAEAQEDYGVGIMRLNVTDEGYGLWTDDVWVDYEGEIESAQDDIVTVYGTITGEKSYDTEIGGSRSIPQVEMRYIEE
jgi:hypothetical protein